MQPGVDYLEQHTGPQPRGTVIWLHGLGADGHDFADLVPQLGLPSDLGLRFIFPHAPVRPITINAGESMRGWYDITARSFDAVEDRAGLTEAAAIVATLIEQEERRGIAPAQVLLAGFSQGGAVALFSGLRYAARLAGLVALSTYLPLAAQTQAEASAANRQTPIFMAHGEYDDVVPFVLAERSLAVLQRLQYQVEWHTYPLPHSLSAEEIQAIAAFIQRVFG